MEYSKVKNTQICDHFKKEIERLERECGGCVLSEKGKEAQRLRHEVKIMEINEMLEQEKKQREHLLTKGLTPRQHRLKDWLKENFVSGRFFTIEEIVANVKDGEGNPYYKLNTNPHTHDKCVALGSDVKELNWHTNRDRYIPIIKDSKGSIKLCESKEELEEYIAKEKRKVEKAYQYYNHLNSLIGLDGTMPIINLANNVVESPKPIDVYAKEGN